MVRYLHLQGACIDSITDSTNSVARYIKAKKWLRTISPLKRLAAEIFMSHHEMPPDANDVLPSDVIQILLATQM